MAAATLRVGATGVLIRLTVKASGTAMDLSSASLKEIDIYKPSGAVVERAATFTTNGTDGKIEAASQEGDFDEVGTYRVVACVQVGSWCDHSSAMTVVVQGVGS